MSRNSDIRRQLGAGMPTPPRDYASERYTVTSKSNVPEPAEKPLQYMIVGGVILVQEDGAWRNATLEEIERLMGDIASWPESEEGEL